MRKINKISKQLVAIIVATLLLPTPTFIYAKEQNSSIPTENDTVIEETISIENDTIIEEKNPTENDTTIEKPMPKAKQKPKSGQKVVQIPNKIIKAAINKELGQVEQADITEKQLASIKELTIKYTGLTTLSGMPKMPNLVYLDLSENKLTNLSGISKLPKLKILHLRRNRLTNLSGISKLSTLSELHLSSNKLKNLKELQSLSSLTRIDIWNNPLKDQDEIILIAKKNKRLESITHSYLKNVAVLEKKMNSIGFEYVVLHASVPDDMVMWTRVKNPKKMLR